MLATVISSNEFECKYCIEAVRVLEDANFDTRTQELSTRELESAFGENSTIPKIFIGTLLIGGLTELRKLLTPQFVEIRVHDWMKEPDLVEAHRKLAESEVSFCLQLVIPKPLTSRVWNNFKTKHPEICTYVTTSGSEKPEIRFITNRKTFLPFLPLTQQLTVRKIEEFVERMKKRI